MTKNRLFGFLMTMLLLLSVMNPMTASADEARSLQDESIYDLLVDRFNNANWSNDEGTDPKDMTGFTGGDFAGVTSRLNYIDNMGFTMISVGPVFHTAKYDGSEVVDYEKFEPFFGTEEEFIEMVDATQEKKIGVIADFPLSGVSEDHVWAVDGTLSSSPAGNGTINWDASNEDVKNKLKETVVSFVKNYKLDGIRLTKLNDFDEQYLNEVIDALKADNPKLYVLTDEVSTANFDSMPNIEKMQVLREAFASFDPEKYSLTQFEDKFETGLIQLDDLTGSRFTYAMIQERMFPPARWKLAATALFTLPGVPLMTYGSEIAMNGEKAPDSHQVANFKTDQELVDYIKNLNILRNTSSTIRNGDFEILHEKDGFTVYKRSSDEETWIIALNNTTVTSNFEIPADVIGDGKKLRGVLDGNTTKQGPDGEYNIVLDREVAEIYIADEDQGFNTLYLVVSILVYVLFLSFLFVVWRRGKKARAEQRNKPN